MLGVHTPVKTPTAELARRTRVTAPYTVGLSGVGQRAMAENNHGWAGLTGYLAIGIAACQFLRALAGLRGSWPWNGTAGLRRGASEFDCLQHQSNIWEREAKPAACSGAQQHGKPGRVGNGTCAVWRTPALLMSYDSENRAP